MNESLLLLIVLGALVAVPLVLRRLRASAPDAVRVVGRTAIHKGAVVAVIAVGDRRLLVGSGEKGVTLLADLDPFETGATSTDNVEMETSTTSTLLTDQLLHPTSSTRTDAGRGEAVQITEGVADLPVISATHDPEGPRIGLVDRLRAMTVRTPLRGRPIDVLRR